jgi:hypothetical protein
VESHLEKSHVRKESLEGRGEKRKGGERGREREKEGRKEGRKERKQEGRWSLCGTHG